MAETDKVQFTTSAETAKRFRSIAAERGISQRDLFDEMMALLDNKKPESSDSAVDELTSRMRAVAEEFYGGKVKELEAKIDDARTAQDATEAKLAKAQEELDAYEAMGDVERKLERTQFELDAKRDLLARADDEIAHLRMQVESLQAKLLA